MNNQPVIVITGAAKGIGEQTARRFAQEGFRLALVDIDKEILETFAAEMSSSGTETLTCPGDLYDQSFAQSVILKTVEKWNRIDILVNNAAWRTIETMRTISLETWDRTMRVCLTTAAFLAKWAAEHMENQGRGVIVNVSSIMSQSAGGYSPAYVCCKGAIESLTYELADLYGPKGIRVVGIKPGAIETALSQDYKGPKGEDISHALLNHMHDRIPLGRSGNPKEVANAIYWLSSDEASYVNGTTLTVDGGIDHNFTGHSIKGLMFPDQFS